MWRTLFAVALLVSCICENSLAQDALRSIHFPVESHDGSCFVDAAKKVRGICKNLAECGSALRRWKNQNIRPQTCYFNKFEHIVCCEIERSPILEPILYMKPMQVKRRSEVECESHQGNKFYITIVRGQAAAANEFPYMAAVGWVSNTDRSSAFFYCAGVLISPNFVLTAAHCAGLGGQSPTVVRIGGTNLTDPQTPNIPIKRIIVHPGYRSGSSYNDIALLELQQGTRQKPACLWTRYDVPHNNVTALGYGHTQFAGANSNVLQKAVLFLVPSDVCQRYYMPDENILQQGLANTQICAGDQENRRDTCQGDSGGPLILKVDRDITYSYVVGITSFGQACGGAPPSIYSRVSAYIDWIEDIVWPIAQLSGFGVNG
ncbi:serine protease snake [Bactrocera neohumeralis]|uniref:serine protease snake n=1 Tax=Bactrocera tryoni TaxID=59916 RepID=UPI001A99F521|nr:serine protease snake [Bactrocera tryoni]XP_050329635.1 serine protease snake [Bactrocera neohumeralis]